MKKSILFVDDEPNLIQGLKRMLRNMRNEWDMYFVDGGEEALTLLSENHIDIIVTDMRMPGIDGATLLGKVIKQYPHMIRIVLSGHSDQEMVLRSTKFAHQFLAKPCDAETLKNTIERTCQLRDILRNETLLKIVTGLKTLPSSPSLYNRIIEEIQSPNVSLKKIGDIIAKDVAMTARVLQLVNSAFFGLPQRIVNPQHAVALLGLDLLKTLVLYIELFSAFNQEQGFNNLFLENLWKHSMRVGDLAKRIAQCEKANKDIIEGAFIGGMLHDIGKLLLLEIPGFHIKIKDFVSQNSCSDIEAEYQILGTSHAEVGAYLLGLWGICDNVIEAVAFHHHPSDLLENKFTSLTAIHMANALINVDCCAENVSSLYIDCDYLASLNITDRLTEWVRNCVKTKEEEMVLFNE